MKRLSERGAREASSKSQTAKSVLGKARMPHVRVRACIYCLCHATFVSCCSTKCTQISVALGLTVFFFLLFAQFLSLSQLFLCTVQCYCTHIPPGQHFFFQPLDLLEDGPITLGVMESQKRYFLSFLIHHVNAMQSQSSESPPGTMWGK